MKRLRFNTLIQGIGMMNFQCKRWFDWKIALSVILMISFFTANSAYATFPAKNGGKIVFQSNNRDFGDTDIFIMNTDGSNVVDLTSNNRGRDETPMWSPDGTKIAFASQRGVNNSFNIYVMNADGSNVQRLTTPDLPTTPFAQRDWFPSWSPDGEKIVFLRLDPNRVNHVFTVNADGTNLQQLSILDTNFGAFPRYSPDGTKIIFQVVPDAQHSYVSIMNANGTNPQAYTATNVEGGNPDWSPNGKRIVFSDFAINNLSHIYIGKYYKNQDPLLAITRDQALLITPDIRSNPNDPDEIGNNYEGASYSPDGKYLLIMAEEGVSLNSATLRNDIYVTRVTDPTHALTNLTKNGSQYADRYPSWQPIPNSNVPDPDEDGNGVIDD